MYVYIPKYVKTQTNKYICIVTWRDRAERERVKYYMRVHFIGGGEKECRHVLWRRRQIINQSTNNSNNLTYLAKIFLKLEMRSMRCIVPASSETPFSC